MEMRKIEASLVDESVLRRTADILGPECAAARALEDAKERRERGESVVFARREDTLLVVPRDAVLDVRS
jgi:hypothetical protein